MVAAAGDHADVVAELVAQPEIDVNARAENDRTALHWRRSAAMSASWRRWGATGDRPQREGCARTDGAEPRRVQRLGRASSSSCSPSPASIRTSSTAIARPPCTGRRSPATPTSSSDCWPMPAPTPGSRTAPTANTAQRVAAARRRAAAVLEERMRSDPGIDELSPGDARPAPPAEEPVFYTQAVHPRAAGPGGAGVDVRQGGGARRAGTRRRSPPRIRRRRRHRRRDGARAAAHRGQPRRAEPPDQRRRGARSSAAAWPASATSWTCSRTPPAPTTPPTSRARSG